MMQKSKEIKESIDLNGDRNSVAKNVKIGCGSCEDDGHNHDIAEIKESWKSHWDLLSALFILIIMLVLKYAFNIVPYKLIDFSIHAIAFLLAGYNV